jgi:hypothetical protein
MTKLNVNFCLDVSYGNEHGMPLFFDSVKLDRILESESINELNSLEKIWRREDPNPGLKRLEANALSIALRQS